MGTDDVERVCLRRLPWEHEISQLTFKGFDKKAGKQLYADGITMNATSTISGGTGENQTLKLRGQQYTISVPSTIKAKKVRLYGYANYSNDIYVSELNGQTFASTDYVITGADKAKQWLDIPLNEEVSGKNLTITLAGDNQPISNIPTAAKKPSNVVYDLQGRIVKRPTRGLYIINGHKVVIK